jgi:transcriptional regulator with XRE-family HTH domain
MRGVQTNGEAVKLARLRRGMNQDDVAHQADLDVKTVRKAEQGKRLDIPTVARIAQVLNVDLLSLITLSNEPIEPVDPPNLQQAKTFVRWYDSAGTLLTDECRQFLALDFEFHCPADPQHVPFAGVWRGCDGFLKFLEIFYSVFERHRNSLVPDYLVADHRVVARYMDQVDQVFYQGHEMPPFWVNLHFQFRDGLLVRVDDEFDHFNARRSFDELLAKLGQTLPPN